MEADRELKIHKKHASDLVIALAGNPNVGKSTLFNQLTGMHQHTGNWPGKTVLNAQGYCSYQGQGYVLVDIPGCYSLAAHSADEEAARDFICSGIPDSVVVVCDATCLERNLILALQIMEVTKKVVVCVNLMDEAAKKGISINLKLLEERLKVPVIGMVARSKKGISKLFHALSLVGFLEDKEEEKKAEPWIFVKRAEEICQGIVTADENPYKRDRAFDKLFTSRLTGFPIMFLFLILIFWITITGANYPSAFLSRLFFGLEDNLFNYFSGLGIPVLLCRILFQGVYRVLAWVVSVMLPPMAIFFPLFTLLEDFGYLPRVAYNLDKCFQRCQACGKQALTMCMGFGCNAAGITGCRIIDSERERLIAIVTNNFIPCNGRFPALIALISMFFVGEAFGAASSLVSAFFLSAMIFTGIFVSLLVSGFLSRTLLKGVPSSFALELPPYRRPQFGKVLVRSIFDRTLFVLGRAVVVAAPAGLIIWIMANMEVEGRPLLVWCTGFLDPFARQLGLDGVILIAFILGFPANEIVIPIMIMAYMAGGSLIDLDNLNIVKELFKENGWSQITALCTMIFFLMHWPCSTSLLTIKKETGSLKWTAISFLVPTICGMLLCFLISHAAAFFF